MKEHLCPRPTADQYQSFGDYLSRAHSWYKHLPLMTGRRFVVFVAPDAGIGRLVAVMHGPPEAATGYTLVTPPEGPEFTADHPRLHYGWQTTAEYRNRFGYLDYASRRDLDEAYCRDVGEPILLSDHLEERCGFVLYPYVSWTFAEAVNWSVHEEALRQLQNGAKHPAREEVLELARAAESLKTTWLSLSEIEQNWVYSERSESEKSTLDKPSTELKRYLELDIRVRAISAALRAQEVEKIHLALTELDGWLA